MAIGDSRLPEGTDHIIGGASVGNDLSSTGGLASTAPGFDNEFDDEPVATSGSDIPTAGYDAASADGDDAAGTTEPASARATIDEARTKVTEKTTELRGQAVDAARNYALIGKERAVEGLDNVQKLINDAADTVESKVGAQYGDYIRQAGASITTLSVSLRDKDVDQLLADARDLVRTSPGIAIGAAAAVGFALVRVAKVGLEPTAGKDAPVTGGVTPIDPVGTRPGA